MLTRRHLFPAAALVAVGAAGLTSFPAWADDGPEATVEHAIGTLQDLRRDKEFGNSLHLISRARAILIAPRIFKAGFFFGGEGGRAVLLARNANGGWSNPAFYTVASGSFGLQIGAQQSEMIMFIMSERALHALMSNKFDIGANAGIAVATLGSTVEGATTTNAGPDIVVWASSSGAYAGISLAGTLVEPQTHADAKFYGRAYTSREIVMQGRGHNPAAAPLVHAVSSL
ncbi:MAG: lipid-binding SYLF domain-containing protein [Proteobacteria bacterium]|nr:lipid-binding SYLF domain-containing protein [Pseudomonadota bacterium]